MDVCVIRAFLFFFFFGAKIESGRSETVWNGRWEDVRNEHRGFGSWVIWSDTILCRDAINRGDHGKNNSRTFERFSYFFNCSKIRIKLPPTNGVENCD